MDFVNILTLLSYCLCWRLSYRILEVEKTFDMIYFSGVRTVNHRTPGVTMGCRKVVYIGKTLNPRTEYLTYDPKKIYLKKNIYKYLFKKGFQIIELVQLPCVTNENIETQKGA